MKHFALVLLLQVLGNLLPKMLGRLTLAAVLGGVIGLERELRRRPAGLRTNMFICFGAAMFTILSMELAQGNEATRIASQIIPGIGFIGAGSILREKGSVTGLTTAATIFVVAAIGMAIGGGLYWLAIFATVLIYAALELLGWVERHYNLKPVMMNYAIVSEKAPDLIVSEINKALEEQDKTLSGMRMTKLNGQDRIVFTVSATLNEHKELMDCLRQSDDLRNVESERGLDVD
jgi:putative Mg2+ transporter-C (MgtC) family protein